MAALTIKEDYWDTFELLDEDVEFIYNHLLENETPLTPDELLGVLVDERIRRELADMEAQRTAGGDLYLPKDRYVAGQKLIFPTLGWRNGKVLSVRPGNNPDLAPFDVIRVEFEDGETREFAANVLEHVLNQPSEIAAADQAYNPQAILAEYGEALLDKMETGLSASDSFVKIAGRWFPLALLLNVNIGHLNLAEALLDMAGGGPLTTAELLEQVGLDTSNNPKLVEFSLDYALERDPRFDEVGPAGQVLWYLHRLEPKEVLETPIYLRYPSESYDGTVLTAAMRNLERDLDDEHSLFDRERDGKSDAVTVRLIFPHWMAGTLPLSSRIRSIFPTAYEAPRVRFILVDGDTGEKFPGWVVRKERYVYGLKEWYQARGLGPGSLVQVQRGKNPGEVIVQISARRSSRDWMRTVLIGSDGGLVFAMLRQVVSAEYDERMAIAVPDLESLEKMWQKPQRNQPLERTVTSMMRELTKLNPQGHVHASELYAAVNLVRRCSPGPLLGLLVARPLFVHVGDLHFRINESE